MYIHLKASPVLDYLLLFSILLITPFYNPVYAQESYTLSGSITDAKNGEELLGASVWIKELETGSTTNSYGFYSLTVPKGTYTLSISYVGYATQEKTIQLTDNKVMQFELIPESTSLEEVIISSKKKDLNVTSTQMSANTLNMQEIAKVPVLFGEKDVLKTIQLLPGIKANEVGSGFFVRGGSAGQNLILLDEAPVYNASHMLGLFSVFNSDAIKDLTLYKGHIPAEYGGRASSVMDVQMNNGNNKGFSASGGIGTIASRLTIEAPIVKDKGSFMLSGRRTYLDLFLKLSDDEDTRNTSLYFYDFNAKANYKIGDKDRVYLSGYFGRDQFSFSDQFGFDWGNTTATLRWNHLFNDKLFSNTTVLYSDYNYRVEIGGDEGKNNGFSIASAIEDFSLKQDYKYYLNPSNTLQFGWNATRYNFVPGEIKSEANANVNDLLLQKKYAWEAGVYISDEKEITEKLSANFGLRYSWFAQTGPGDIFTYDADGDVATTTNYDSGEFVKSYGGFEPRVGLTYLLSEQSSIKASYNRNRQFSQLPFNLYAFKDGIYIEGTHKNYPEALGAKVLAIAGTPIAEVLQAIEPTVPAENTQYFKAYGINNLRYPEVLHAQKVTKTLQQEVTFKLEKNGEVFNQIFTALPKGKSMPTHRGFVTPDENWLSARNQDTTPLYLQQLDKVYLEEYLPEEQAMYVRHSRIQDEAEENTKDFYARVFEELKANDAEKLIIDLRLNGGGNNYLNKDIIKGLIKTEQINQVGKLFVIIGKRTFSACQNLVNELDNYTNVIFVGEPTAENINFWGDNRPVTLPNSGITVSLSYLWWQDKPALENAEWIAPSLPVTMRFEEYKTNQDPVLKAALEFDNPDFKPKPIDYIVSLYLSGQNQKLAEELPRMIQDPLYAFCDFENGLIQQGNLLLQSGRVSQIQAAIQVFSTVLSLFPDSANAYKHLGESYIATGNTQKAKEVLHKAIALDPDGVGVAAERFLKEI